MNGQPINKVLYPVQRFKVMGFLCQVEKSNYASIGEFTGLAVPDISKTVRTLEEHGYVVVFKTRRERYSETIVRSTELGRTDMAALVQELKKYLTPVPVQADASAPAERPAGLLDDGGAASLP